MRDKMDIAEFRALGYLQEANRLFFHPLGLALEVALDGGGTETLSAVWDCRNDPEGIMFGESMIRQEAIDAVEAERRRHLDARIDLLGSTGIQGPA